MSVWPYSAIAVGRSGSVSGSIYSVAMLWLSSVSIAATGSATVRLRSDGQLNFAFGTEGSPTQQLRLERDTPFAANARVIHGNEPLVRDTAPPVLNVFRTRGVNDTTGDWARLTLSTPATMHTVHNLSLIHI